jgi:putative transposase
VHLASDAAGMPLGAVVTGANANEGRQARAALESMVIRPPAGAAPAAAPDARDLPRVRADGGYGNGPTRERARQAGFRVLAPGQGRPRPPGLGRVRAAVERGHSWLNQFGRVGRPLDRSARGLLGWVQLAACIVFIRAEANGFFR